MYVLNVYMSDISLDAVNTVEEKKWEFLPNRAYILERWTLILTLGKYMLDENVHRQKSLKKAREQWIKLRLRLKFFWDFKKYFIYLFEAEEKGGGRERESETDSLLSGVQHGVQSMTARPWHESKPRIRCLTDWVTQVPLKDFIYLFER